VSEQPVRIVIVGTGTDVGKTHAGVALVTALAKKRQPVCGLKPIESGVRSGEVGADALALATASMFHVKHPAPFVFADPVSPHLAARRAGVLIDVDHVRQWVDSHATEWVIVETAGGLLSPIGPKQTNLDVAEALTPDGWLLVGVDRLGVLHDIAACLFVLRARVPSAAARLAVLLQTPLKPDASTGTNADELRLLGISANAVTMPRGAPASPDCQTAAGLVLTCFT
jgi:dethiobiotin synthetase